jgi:O-antigen/teichoic acid export membrane protein
VTDVSDVVAPAVSATELRSHVVWTFVIQGVGSAASFLTVIVLSYTVGPAAQGRFSEVKTEVEFLAALASLGLPQALLYYVGRHGISMRSVRRWILISAFTAVVSTAVYAVLHQERMSPVYTLALVIAVTLMTVHGSFRTITLAKVGHRQFNVATAAPQLIMLGLILLASELSGTSASYAIAMAVAFGVVTMLLACWCAGADVALDGEAVGARSVFSYGAAAWGAAAAATLGTLLCVRALQDGGHAADVGVYTVGIAIIQIVLTPLNFMLPILLHRWSIRKSGPPSLRPIIVGIGFAGLVGGGAAALVGDVGLPSWMPRGYEDLVPVLQVLVWGLAIEFIVRMLVVSAYSLGRPWFAVAGEASRVVTIAVALHIGANSAVEAAGAWTCGALAAGLVVGVLTTRATVAARLGSE